VQELLIALRAAKIKPSTAFLNGLLAFGVKTRRKAWTWSTFQQMVQHEGVVPNQETFLLLWQRMKTHVDPVLNRTREGFPSCRTLFAEMARWSQHLKRTDFSRELYDQIILCFGLSDDQMGTAVALRAMQQLYNIYPNEDTVRSVVLQLAKAGSRNVFGFRPRRLNLNAETMKRIRSVTMVLKNLKDQRVTALRNKGIDFDSLDADSRSEESLQLLCNLLRFAAESRARSDTANSSPENDTDDICDLGQSVAEQMGVPDCVPWPE